MPNLTYNIFTKPKNLTSFAAGSGWLIGVSAEKKEDLIAKIKPLVESGNIDSNKIQEGINEFIEWFIEDYEQREKKDCTLDESEIVESLGIVTIDKTGQVLQYTYGKFKFYLIDSTQTINMLHSNTQLAENQIIIADPKNIGVANSILEIEYKTDKAKYKDFSYPFAIIRTLKEIPTSSDESNRKMYWKEMILLLSVLLVGGVAWLNKDSIESFLHQSNLASDTTVVQQDSSSVKIPKPTINNPDLSEPTTIETTIEELNAEDYFDKAEESLNFAISFMADGKNAKALVKLDSAEIFYKKTIELEPNFKEKIQPKLNDIIARKAVLKEGNDKI